MDAVVVPVLFAAFCLQLSSNANTSEMTIARSTDNAIVSTPTPQTRNIGVLAQSDYSSCLDACLNQRCRPRYDLCQQISDNISDCNRQWEQCY
jgi:hypothetical protein